MNNQSTFKKEKDMRYKVKVLTGVRPTGSLTVANYLGAVAPIIEFQNQGLSPVVFIANIHAITDREPSVVKQYIQEIVADYIALGIDPRKTKIYLQSEIAGELTTLTAFLARHISVAELLRVPTLKDKIKQNKRLETANALLFFYPVLMAADILLNKAERIPVGEDQLSHLEVTRLLARRFNKKYGEVFPIPKILQTKALRILSLKGIGKMSKTNPEGAIFLTDEFKVIARKIKSAETDFEGKMNERLQSHILVASGLTTDESRQEEINVLVKEHMTGKPVMGKFKQLFTNITQDFLREFQIRKSEILTDPSYISSVLAEGAKIARKNASETLREVKDALRFT